MEEISVINKQLPDNIEDLSKFALIGREKLNAVRAEIRAIDKVGLAKEVHEQKLKEAQEIAEAVLDAEVKIGELLKNVPKQSGARTDLSTAVSTGYSKAKQEVGISQKQAERFQTLASNKEAVEQAKEDARKNERIVTRSEVINNIVNDRKKKQKQELREAKAIHEDFTNNSDSVVEFSDLIAEKEALKKISDYFYNELISGLRHYTKKAYKTEDVLRKYIENLTSEKCEILKKSINFASIYSETLLRIMEELNGTRN